MKWNESHKKESISRFTETRVNDIIPKDEAVLGNVHPKKSDKRNTNIETLGLTIQVPQIEADQLHDFEDEQPILATSAYRHLIQIKASLDPTGKEELSEGEVRTPRGSGEGRKRSGSVHEFYSRDNKNHPRKTKMSRLSIDTFMKKKG
ncbi:hypothetical protein AX774_g3758 [Zancudomyces culisetae]|uniref:Uncharacterized protein n=1 Tax=Zancudomyces culisetae TaxID=1213189 RepID=A0A1R1PP62_ZANCU|nr:hypothetical protein AX774_g3758 [Zancudomyces culisetae]|eukprot:OMH82757.1 hypothetical protein AX774_g3758 [Zancudomyces culisetae]